MTTDAASARKPLRTLFVERFHVAVDLAENNACGGVHGMFDTELAVSTRGLDDNGYVTEVQGLMNKIISSFAGLDAYDMERNGDLPRTKIMLKASCEDLGSGVMNVIHRVVGTERLERVHLRVWNMRGYIDLNWERGDEIPEFPRLASDDEQKSTLKEREKARREGREPRRSFC